MMDEYLDVLDAYGAYTGKVESREKCHKEGLWHTGVVAFIVSSDNQKVLLQKRSANKRLWPNLWDMTAGGHVLHGELSYQAAMREAGEEIGIDISKDELEFIGATTSENIDGDIINRHYNIYFVAHKDADLKDIVLQKEEVQDIRWFSIDELTKMIDNNYDGITDKIECWNHLLHYLSIVNTAAK